MELVSLQSVVRRGVGGLVLICVEEVTVESDDAQTVSILVDREVRGVRVGRELTATHSYVSSPVCCWTRTTCTTGVTSSKGVCADGATT